MSNENKKYKSIYKQVIHTPVYKLKALGYEELQEILEKLRTEMREMHRAVNWVEGIIRLKDIEKEKSS